MPWAALQRCSSPGCGVKVPKGRCAAHARQRWATRPSFTARYGTGWSTSRRQVLAEEPQCRHCGSTDQPTVDHATPISQGGTHDRSNLQRLCAKCQDSKARAEAWQTRRAGRQ